jgi:ATP-dependent Clp endopeptidase proteolytic subunit ClpP
MSKTHFSNVSNDGKSADIYIYGPIGFSWFDENSWTASSFVKEFNALAEKYDRVNIHINSPGGIIDEGLPIFNAIQSCTKETHTYIDGIAFSMGAVIALAGKTVHAAKNSLILFHNASGWASGNAQDMRETADMLDTYDTSLITSLSSKTGLTEGQIREKYFDFKDHLMNASDAKEAGFIDVIEDFTAKIPKNVSDLSGDQLYAFFQNQDKNNPVAKKLFDFFKNSFSFTNKSESMENPFVAIGALLGIVENATAESVTAAINALNQKVADLTASSKACTDALASFNTSIDAIDASVATATGSDAKLAALNAFITSLRNVDATDKTVAGKKKDEIEAPPANAADSYAHNVTADRVLG